MKLVFLLCVLTLSSFGYGDAITTTQAHSKATLISERQSLSPGKNRLGLHIELDPFWHTYWRNPGDSAAKPIFEWKTPNFITVSETIYPYPKRIPFGPLQSFGYESEVVFLFDAFIESVPTDTHSAEIILEAEWLVCKEECIPGIFTFSKIMPITNKPGDISYDEPLIANFNQRIPKISNETYTWTKSGDSLTLNLPKNTPALVEAFPFSNQLVDNSSPKISAAMIQFKTSKSAKPTKLERFLFIPLEGETFVVEAKEQETGLFLILAMAFLGGLILNVMPCVFPILSLKLMMLIKKSREDYLGFVASNFIYSIGVIVSFCAIALLMILLNTSGNQLGWGFQLQSPSFVIFLIVLFSGMALIFADLIPVNFAKLVDWSAKTEGALSGWKSSFFTGVLAVVVASPCTAPFMGAAMGYTLGQSPSVVLAVFACLGLGLASPFLLVSLFPSTLKLFPSPGPWMTIVKKLMAIPMLLTVAWLIWVLSLQIGSPESSTNSMWESFDSAKLELYKTDDRPIFLNATAAWCISCQVNDRLVFRDSKVIHYFQENKFHMVKADWTNKDEKIAQLLKNYQRVGVPLYLYFPPKSSTPRILPEVLTVDSLLSNLEDQ